MYSYQLGAGLATLKLDYYPFLADPDAIARRRYGLSVADLARLRRDLVEAGYERVVKALREGRLEGGIDSLEREVFGFAYASAIAVLAGDRWLLARYSLAEAERAYQLAQRESDEALAQLARMVGISSLEYGKPYKEPVAIVRGVVVYRQFMFSLSLVEYVRVAKRLLGDDAWKPINFPVLHGRIYVERQHMLRLVKEALTVFIEKRVEEVGGNIAAQTANLLSDYVEKLRKELSERRRPRSTGGGRVEVPEGVVVEDAFPPCIRDLVERARRGENLSHHERFALATFLLNIGAEIDFVVDMFRNMPDFNEKITRYQVEHLAGLRGSRKKYRVYSCEKMRTLGICKADCENTRSPLQAYYRNLRAILRRQRIRVKRGSEQGGQEAGKD